MDNPKQSSVDTQWLLSVEQNSWQIELLISGGLLITLYYLPEYINQWMNKVVNDSELTTGILLILLMALIITKALLIGFGSNLLLRSMWLASLGVHFAYPEGIKEEELDYNADLKQKLTPQEGPHSKVLMLEKLSSLSYSLAIIFTIYSAGAMLIVLACYFLIFEPFLSSSVYDNKWFGYSFLLIVILFSIGSIDHFVLTRLKKNSTASRRYFRFSQWLSYLNLTSIFKYEWTILTSHINRWKLYLICFIYFGVALLLSLNDISWSALSLDIQSPLDHRNYTRIYQEGMAIQNNEYLENYDPGDYIDSPIIPSEIINSSYLEVFLPYDKWYDDGLRQSLDHFGADWKPDESTTRKDLIENFEAIQNSLNEVYLLSVDRVYLDSVRWYMRKHPHSEQLGFHIKIDIDTLDRGGHSLSVYYQQRLVEGGLDTFGLRYIPFWIDK